MLPKAKRLTRDEFSRFFASGKRVHTPAVQFVYTPSTKIKVAVVVGKKVYKNAVDRNHLRRQLYHIMRDWLAESGAQGVFILIAKPPIREYSYRDLESCVSETVSTFR